jgi:diguanylate cyclase (GGDEF)-like protein
MKNTTVISLLATISLFCVVVTLSGFAIGIALLNQQATNSVETSIYVSGLYQQVLKTFNQQEEFEDEYPVNHNSILDNKIKVGDITILNLLRHLQSKGNANSNRAIKYIFVQQQLYQRYENQFFSSIDRGDLNTADELLDNIIEPMFDQITLNISDQEGLEQTSIAHNITQLSSVQNMIVMMTPVVFAIGVLLTGVSFYASRTYSRKIDEAAQAEVALLEKVVSTDPLTGLGNHYAYQESLSRILAEAGEAKNTKPVVIVLLDIDDFKQYNDESGYQYGDEILIALAGILQDAHISDALFRLSGDDFAMIISHKFLTEVSIALKQLSQKIQQHSLGITVSIGTAHSDSSTLTSELLHPRAMAALREAKRRGRNRMLTFEAIEGSVQLLSPAKARAIRLLLHEGKMSIAFQPIWNLANGNLFAFEALARPPAEYGFAGPQEMFDIAEQMGRAHELDYVCVRAILARAADLPPDVLLFINLTPQTLIHDLLTGAVLLSSVVEAGLKPSRVVLEITERSIANLAEVIEKARQLQFLGFQIALDDAGAGNAGLEMLSLLHIQFVKIDRAIVSHALTDQAARSVFAGITTIARESSTIVIAEGIETPEILSFVKEAYGDYVQGYLLGRPSESISQARTLQVLQQDLQDTRSSTQTSIKKGV